MSDYRVTLTYNHYSQPVHPGTSFIPTPFHLQLKQVLVDLVNDKSKLSHGGYLGFGLAHEYVHTGHNPVEPLLAQLKGSDRALKEVCDELGLRHSLRLLYRRIIEGRLNLVTTKELHMQCDESRPLEYLTDTFYIMRALKDLDIEQVEVVDLIGSPCKFDPEILEWGDTVDDRGSPAMSIVFDPESDEIKEELLDWGSIMKRITREPVTQVLEVAPMASSVDVNSSILRYGNEATLDFFYGTACMLIAVDSAESRKLLEG